MKKKVTVIVPTYQHWDELRKCVNALQDQSYPEDAFEVLIINNDPTSKLPFNFELSSNFKLLEQSTPGSYAARNKGIECATGDIIAFTDSDCIPHRDWLRNGVEALGNEVELVAGHVEVFFESTKLNFIEIYEKMYAFDQENNAKNGVSVTANMIVKKSVFDKVGNFDDLLMSGGDFEWSRRATVQKFSLKYCSAVRVRHPSRSNRRDFLQKLRRTTGGRYKFINGDNLTFLSFFLRGVLPPIKAVIPTMNSDKGNFKEKIIALIVMYLVKLYCTCYMLKLCLTDTKLERQ